MSLHNSSNLGVGPLAKVLADGRWEGDHGIGRFSRELIARTGMTNVNVRGALFHTLSPIRLSSAIRREVQDSKVFFTPGFLMPWPMPRGVVCVPTLHDLIHLRTQNPAISAYYRFVACPMVRRAPLVITVSETSKRLIVEWASIDPSRVVVVPNGVSECFTDQGAVRGFDRATVLYVGNRKSHKNLKTLIQAIAMLGDDGPSLAMSGCVDTQTAQLLDNEGLLERTTWLGLLSDSELAEVYRGATLTALVSYEEGFGLPVLESMACGTPVLASNIESLTELAGGVAEFVDPHCAESVADGLVRLLGSQGYRDECSVKGLDRASEFCWDRSASLLVDAIRPLISSESP